MTLHNWNYFTLRHSVLPMVEDLILSSQGRLNKLSPWIKCRGKNQHFLPMKDKAEGEDTSVRFGTGTGIGITCCSV